MVSVNAQIDYAQLDEFEELIKYFAKRDWENGVRRDFLYRLVGAMTYLVARGEAKNLKKGLLNSLRDTRERLRSALILSDMNGEKPYINADPTYIGYALSWLVVGRMDIYTRIHKRTVKGKDCKCPLCLD